MDAGLGKPFLGVVDWLIGDFASKLLRFMLAALGGPAVGIEVERPIDARIARLDEARSALADSLSAIDDLRADADKARAEHDLVVAALQKTLATKDDTEKKLASIQRIITEDVTAFQTVAGVSDIRKERMIGFASGIMASIIASALWSWCGRFFTSWEIG